jgi:hypothetical protein
VVLLQDIIEVRHRPVLAAGPETQSRVAHAIETGRLPRCSGVVIAIDDIMVLTLHAPRVNATVSVAAHSWRFTYLCWNIPAVRTTHLSSSGATGRNSQLFVCAGLPLVDMY